MIRAAVVTVSDTRSKTDDISGDRLVELLSSEKIEITERVVTTDDLDTLTEALRALCRRQDINLILTTGGTGFAPRDNTPEATGAVIEREAQGIAEAIRRETASKTPLSMLSRGIAGIRGKTLIINLPGSPKAVEECFEVVRPVLSHAIELLAGES
ncbi:MAG: MogA/MoaB family molybdenum cofactor biosynthesis protein, partial [Acidobacteria bacterium]|nr:MogA/MoaB family molybdenum cofactor biosynthesis protein [Acidobacteriota bacterium]